MASGESIKLVVFLGNPGREYLHTRHNAGWLLLDLFAGNGSAGSAPAGSRSQGVSAPRVTGLQWQKKFKASWTKAIVGGSRSVILLKPETMMNGSGESVQAAVRFFKIDHEQIMVVHDDVELAFGEVAARSGGGLAGHNGLRSIANRLGTREFWRLRIGIGRPKHGELRGHVLGRFSSDEAAVLSRVLDAGAALLHEQLAAGPEDAVIAGLS